MKNNSIFVSILFFFLLTASCKKEYDAPPLKEIKEGAKLSLKKIKARVPASPGYYKFEKGDSTLYCTVISDEVSGNFYQQVFAKDEAGEAILLNLKESGGLYAGDKIRINLNGCFVFFANSMFSLDSVDVAKSVVKLSSGNSITAKVATIEEIVTYSTNPTHSASLQSQLVSIQGVEFISNTLIPTFSDAIGKGSVNQTITACVAGHTLIVRSSGRANFARKPLPDGNGSITGIVSQYNSTMQLAIREFGDVNMNGKRCSSIPTTGTFVLASPVSSINETFSNIAAGTDFTQSGWINLNDLGIVKWKGDVTSSNYKALKASAYGNSNSNTSIWLITPPVVYKSTMGFSFKSAYTYWDANHQDALMAYVSTDFNGTNFVSANWTAITSAVYTNGTGPYYTGAAGMKSSGTIALNTVPILKSYSGNLCIAFKYSGSPAFNSDIYLDDILVQ